MNEHHLKRLIYRGWYRGCKETDQLIGPFARGRLALLTPVQQQSFEALLGEPDQDIWAWATQACEAPEHYRELIVEMVAFRTASSIPSLREGG